jgi:hypothetical protein
LCLSIPLNLAEPHLCPFAPLGCGVQGRLRWRARQRPRSLPWPWHRPTRERWRRRPLQPRALLAPQPLTAQQEPRQVCGLHAVEDGAAGAAPASCNRLQPSSLPAPSPLLLPSAPAAPAAAGGGTATTAAAQTAAATGWQAASAAAAALAPGAAPAPSPSPACLPASPACLSCRPALPCHRWQRPGTLSRAAPLSGHCTVWPQVPQRAQPQQERHPLSQPPAGPF